MRERSGSTASRMSPRSSSAWHSASTIKYYSKRAAKYVLLQAFVWIGADFLQNRMMESLVLFDSVVNSRWFMRTSIVLFLNKVDLFRQKLKKSPLGDYFPDYSGGDDVNRAAKYLLWRFNQVNRAHLNLYPQYVTSRSRMDHAVLTTV